MIDSVTRYEQGRAALVVHRSWCKGCDICVDACPTGILALDEIDLIYVTDISLCIFCGLCAARCPDFVFVLERPSGHVGSGTRIRNTAEASLCS